MKGIWKNKKNELKQKTKFESSSTLKKEDFLKDGKKEKENTQNSVITVKIPLSIVILVLVMALFLVYFFVSKNNINFFNSSNNNYSSESIDEKAIDIGSKGYISSAEIIQTKTGTGPWDENDEPGNDSSEDNDIVRSFDQVVWTVDLTMSLKDNSQGASLSGGRIEVEAELPENCADVMKWDLESMLWMENGKVSADGRSITGSYTMTDTEVTVPGKQTLVFVLKVENAVNETEISPTFKFRLTGNEQGESIEKQAERTIVSATPRYNIMVQKNSQLNYRSYFDLETGNESDVMNDNTINGRIQGYGIMIQLYNNHPDKEMKGIELPEGDISFDIVLSESETTSSEPLKESNFIPVLWDYKENMPNINSGKLNRNLYWGGSYKTAFACTPLSTYNKDSNRASTYCYDGGNWTIEQTDSNTYHVTIKNYQFDTEQWHFPRTGVWTSVSNNIDTYIGDFSAGYIQAILQFPEEVEDVTSLYLKMEVKNMNIISASGVAGADQNEKDNMINTQIVLYPPGNLQKYNRIYSANETRLASENAAGDAYAAIGQTVNLVGGFAVNNLDDTMYAYNLLQKFDDRAFEVPAGSNTNSGTGSSPNFSVLYAAKPDGTGWKNEDEMKKAKEEDLIYFSNIDELNARGYTCIAVLFEARNLSISGNVDDSDKCRIPVKVKQNTELVNKTFATVNNLKAWTDNISFSYLNQEYIYDEETGITTMKLVEEYPEPWRSVITDTYIKTEYDENGQIVSGTHYKGYIEGNTLLVTGAKQSIDIKSIDQNNSEVKTNYDIGKNENEVLYKVSPKLTISAGDKAKIENVTLQIKVTLPNGLEYIPGYSNSTETSFIKKDDGSTEIIWNIYGVNVGEEINPITFKAKIDNETENGTQYEVKAIISELINNKDDAKIGNGQEKDRTSTEAINIINLASHRLYKEVENPVIEKNGEIKYKIVYENKTDDPVSDFQLLDIMPYNGDDRGSIYNGTYTIKNININQKTNGKEQSADNLSIYTTASETVREMNSKDSGIGIDSIWKEQAVGAEINESASGIAVKGRVAGRTKVEVEVTLKTTNNKARDVYVNNVMAQVYADSEQMVTGNVKVQVVYREIKGTIWEDLNKNGTIESEEPGMSGIKVTLINTGTKEEKEIITKEEGTYVFEDLGKGKYKVKVEGYGEAYEITEKEVGTNREINSKIDEKSGETEEITKLDSIESPEIIEEYVNGGIKKKEYKITTEVEGTGGKITGEEESPYEVVDYGEDSTKEIIATPEYGYKVSSIEVNGEEIEFVEKADHTVELNKFIDMREDKHVKVSFERIEGEVIVHHYIEGTTDKVPSTEEGQVVEDETIRGYVGEGYTTEVADNVDEGYENVSVTGETEGKIEENTKEVIYYYNLKDPIIASEITKESKTKEIVESTGKVEYEITYKAEVQDYRGKVLVTIVDYLPYEINVKESEIAGGEYDYNTKTIMWEEEIENVDTYKDGAKEISITKNIELVFMDLDGSKEEIKNKVDGTINLYTPEKTEVVENENKVPINIKGTVIAKYLEEGTEKELAKEETYTGKVGSAYETEQKEITGYDYVRVVGNKEGNIKEGTVEVIYYYKLKDPIIASEITKGSNLDKITSAENEITYNISYKTEIKDYRGNGKVTIVDYLASKIDIEKSDIAEGKYDEENLTITWEEEIENIDTYTNGAKEVEIEKTVKVVYENLDEVGANIVNRVEGKVELETPEKEETVEDEITTPVEIPGKVIVKYLEEGTERVLAEQEEINGTVGSAYKTGKKDIVGYDYVRVVGIEEGKLTEKTIEVIYYYRIKPVNIIQNEVTKDGTLSIEERTDKVSYNLVYEGVIDTYRGEVVVYLEDTLPYKIDVDESNLDGGTYDEDTNTIKWYENIGEVDTLKTGENIPETIRVEKNIEVLYENIDVYKESMINNLKGVMYLPVHNKTVEDEDDHETDINVKGDLVVKYVDKASGEEIAERVEKTGRVGTAYDVSGDKKEIEGYTIVEEPAVKTGTYTEEKQEKIYYYAKNTDVHVRYVDKATGEEIAEDEVIKGYEGKQYETDKKEIEGYTFVEDSGNTEGTMERDRIEVVYYYLYNTKARVEHRDRNNNELLGAEEKDGLVGDIYETSPKDFEGYVLVEEPEEKTIVMQREEVVVIYWYSYVSGGVIEKHIDDITGEVLAEEVYEGTEGDPYETHEKEFPIYDLVEEKYPANSKGTMTRDVIEVKYYYIKRASVRVEYIDKVNNEKLTEDVIIKGHENDEYKTEEKEFEGYDLVEIPENATGEMKITVNEDGTYETEIVVTYYYKYISAGVIEKHIDEITGEVLAEEEYKGYEGDKYKTEEKEFTGYDLVEEKYPENSEGTMTREVIEVDYYYIKKANVRVEYIDKLTGEKLTEDVIISGHENDEYKTEQKEFEGYDFIEVVGNTEGVMVPETETVITYYYLKPATVIVRYLEEETEKELEQEDVILGHEGDEYVTGAKEIEYYKISKLPDNAAGTMKDTIYVTYYYKRKTVDFSIDKKIGRIEIDGKKQRITNEELGKAEVYRKSINSTEIRVEYEIEVRNEGEIAGNVTILEKIPEYLSMKKADNPGWEITGNEARYETEEIGVGESKTYKVVMEWKKGDGHFGMQTNIAKIEEVSTPSGFEEENLQNNADEAEVMITISTGVEKVSGIVLIALIYILAIIYMSRRLTFAKVEVTEDKKEK